MALSAQEVLQLLQDHGVRGRDDLATWLAVAMAESSLRPEVVNSIGAVGLYQILQPVHVREHPTWTVEWLKDPGHNVAAARVVSHGWTDRGPWVASTLGQVASKPAAVLQVSKFLQSPAERAVESAVTSPVGRLAVSLTDSRTWLRVAYGVIGAGLIWVAVLDLAQGKVMSSRAVQVVAGTARRVAKGGK